MLNAHSSFLIVAAVVLAGCKSIPSIPPSKPPLTLLSAASLELPDGCVASGAFTVTFTVASSGLTKEIRATDVPTCAGSALTAWVETFRYRPPGRDMPTKIEWMMVAARRVD